MNVSGWLRSLGLAQYEAAFRQHDIDAEVLPDLTEADLERLGISLGHRKRLLKAIRALQTEAPASEPTTLPASQPMLDASHLAERRQVTVMFCDLVGSTVLSTRLDPEDLREVIGDYQRRVAQTISQFEGFVARYLGDGVLAYFGYPHAHEDDAEQAMRAGLALIDAVGELQAPHRLQVRVGIATGVVVVGDVIGTGSAQEQAIVGETPNLAARLQALADPDAVVIAESTRRQIGTRFEVCDLGPQSLKGFAEPQRAWRVVTENRALGRFEALRSGATPLIGRDEELELLLRRWTQAKAGSGRVVLISGEPGVGKSRLAEALEEKIAGEPHIRLRYFCSPHHENSAFHPIIVHIEHAAGFARENAPRKKLAKLQELLAATALPPEDVALIAELHALPSADIAAPLDVSPQRKKEKTFEALLRQVEGLSRQQTVLMVFEDVHWIDPSSQELLDRTIERIASWPVLLLATFRPEFQPPWTGQPHVTTLALTRLNRNDTAAMVANIAGNALPSEAVQEIAERTDGIPLFVEELTRAVLEAGAQGGAALSSVQHPAFSMPAGLHALLMARLDRLGATAKNVAQTGAAIGREFGFHLLASVSDLSEPLLRDALDRLTNSGLLFARGTPPQSAYIFKHALVQDAAYGTLLRGQRQQLHVRIVMTLEDKFLEIVQAQPGLLARHSEEAGLREKEVAYRLTAGQQAIARSAITEAFTHLRRSLEVLTGLPDSAWLREQELKLHMALAWARAITKGFSAPEVDKHLTQARTLAEQNSRGQYLVQLAESQFSVHLGRSELKSALTIAKQIEKLGEAQRDVSVRSGGQRLQGITRYFLGEFVAASSLLLGRVLELADSAYLAIRFGSAVDPYSVLLGYLGLTLASLGYIDQARSRINEGLARARANGQAFTLCYQLGLAENFDALTRSPELELHVEELLTLSTKHGFQYYIGSATSYRGWLLVQRGKLKEGLTLVMQEQAAILASGTVIGMSGMLTGRARIYAMLGRLDEGMKCLQEARQFIEATDERLSEADLYRVRGDLLNATGDRSAAEQSYRQALAVAEHQRAKLFELRAATSLARLWRDQGKIADARTLLAPIYGWFTEGFDAPDLIEAKALLDELAANCLRMP